MAVKLWSNKIEQFCDGTGVPRAGAKLFTYVGGSVNTKQTTYTESTGVTPNTNPIILDANGKTPQPIWLTTGVNYKFVLAPPTDTDPPTSAIDTIDVVTGINDNSASQSEWIAGPAPTFVSATSFTLVGDQTTNFHIGRRLKTTNTSGTIYSTITNSVFGALTTLTVENDSGVLDSGLSAVSYGIISQNNDSDPAFTDQAPVVVNKTDRTKRVRISASGLTAGATRVWTAPDYNITLGNIPAGVIMDYAGSSVPTGWLECDGSAVTRTGSNALLFAAISTTWGVGDGVTTFNLPDFRGRARIGKGTGTLAETVAAASVSTGSDNFTVASNNTKWVTGQPVILTTTGGLPAGLAVLTTYYLVRSSATLIQFATTLANAQNGVVIDITTQGTGNHTVTGTLTARTLAEIGGEESHALSITELLAHTHSIQVSAGALAASGANVNPVSSGTSGSTGGNVAMNIMQPFATTMAIIKT